MSSCGRVRRVLLPTGFAVVFLGPDGSGKSSAMEAVAGLLAPAFRKQAQYHLRPFFLRARNKGNGEPVTDLHASPKYGFIISVIKIFYLWLDYTIGYIISVHWKKTFSTLVLFDRYFHDILIDPLRFRYSGPCWLATILVRAIPKPDAIVLLNVLQTLYSKGNGKYHLMNACAKLMATLVWLKKNKKAFDCRCLTTIK